MLSENIKCAREYAGLRKSQVAKALELPYTTYDSYERGKSEPSAATLRKIATLFHVSMEFLTETKPPHQVNPNEALEEKESRLELSPDTLVKLLTPDEKDKLERINNAFYKLNTAGKDKAVERVEELAEIPRFTRENAPDSPAGYAVRDTDADE